MTVTSTTTRNDYTASASQTDFPYTFKVFQSNEIVVYLDGVIKALTTDYTVTNAGNDSGGNVVFNAGLTGGEAVAILRDVQGVQETDYTDFGAFPAASHETALDRLTILHLQQLEKLDRAIKFAASSTTAAFDMPEPEAGKTLRWNASNTALENAAGAIGSWKGDWTALTSYAEGDIAVDAGGEVGQDNVYIATATHVATGSFATDIANWDLLIDVAAVKASETAAAASATTATTKASEASTSASNASASETNAAASAASAQAAAASVSGVNTGDETKASIDALGVDAATVGGKDASALLAGRKNTVINGAFNINQREYVSGTATVADEYTLDRWKVTGIGGITFSTTNNKTTVTIPVGQTLRQTIEGLNLQSGDYVLSWEGTAQGRIGAGVYGDSGNVTSTLTGGTNIDIEFNDGTVANVQLEKQSSATDFEIRSVGEELSLCQRYYYKAFSNVILLSQCTPSLRYVNIFFPVEMRAEPTMSATVVNGATVLVFPFKESVTYRSSTASTVTNAVYITGLSADAEL